MKRMIFFSENNWTGLVLRLTLGFIMLPHGMQKMFGLFGGNGFRATMDYFTDTMKIPFIVSLLIIAIEFFCSIGLIAGFSSRICALLFLVIMTGAILTTNYNHGFFMNWIGNQKGEGFEYHLLVIGQCIALLVTGSGKYSIDNMITAFINDK